MRVDITEKGVLIVAAQTSLEVFALHAWLEQYKQCKTALGINLDIKDAELVGPVHVLMAGASGLEPE